ncbi:MAG: YifB family Mg chelatase-like AAA ATPase [Eubacterium sp.]|nr:YifB family Mg chelatase-like AAA ATPase [Eubacterium sp.]
MYGRVYSGMPSGIDAIIISVETDISPGLPGMSMVGYLASSVKEASERVRTAFGNNGIVLPSRRITINLYPADIRKDGTVYDLAIAVSILISLGRFGAVTELEDTLVLGELSLDGEVHQVTGVLPVVHFAAMNGFKNVILPLDNMREASFTPGIRIIGVGSLKDAVDAVDMLINGGFPINTKDNAANKDIINEDSKRKDGIDTGSNNSGKYEGTEDVYMVNEGFPEKVFFRYREQIKSSENDLSNIIGQDYMKKGLLIAAAGMHHILLTGVAGAGKSMTAKCLPGILPELTWDERIELTKIYSVAGLLKNNDGLLNERPFRAPHSSVTEAAMIGGGISPRPGEVSLAHRGVLFLDEFPEFKRNVIESLRQPMEDKVVTISRQRAGFTYPSGFMLVAARNNCPCGAFPDRNICHCRENDIYKYRERISHPIMDRIDICIEVRAVEREKLLNPKRGMSSEEASAIIAVARDRQQKRFKNESFTFNSDIPRNRIYEFIKPEAKVEKCLINVMKEQNMSARAFFKLLVLSRTVADINDHDEIDEEDLMEAVFFRNSDREGAGI